MTQTQSYKLTPVSTCGFRYRYRYMYNEVIDHNWKSLFLDIIDALDVNNLKGRFRGGGSDVEPSPATYCKCMAAILSVILTGIPTKIVVHWYLPWRPKTPATSSLLVSVITSKLLPGQSENSEVVIACTYPVRVYRRSPFC